MMQTKWKRKIFLLAFEVAPTFKGLLPWMALASLGLLVLPVRFIFIGEFSVNGQPLAQDLRLNYVLAVGYSSLVFLTTLLALSLCLDRTGINYLRNNDLLVLARNFGRPAFYLTKIASVLGPVILYAVLGLTLFWEELYRLAGVNLFRVFLLIFPLSLSMACLITMYFLIRHFLRNFVIFFLSLLLLPVIYVGNLWRYYGGALREGVPHAPILGLLPQFGGIHAYSLGLVADAFLRDDTWYALANCFAWMTMALVAGLALFNRKRL